MNDTSSLLTWVLISACVGSGMMAGLFAAFSGFMMRALASLAPAEGIRAMQAINRDIVSPSFLAVFLGTGALAVTAAVLGWDRPAVGPLAAGAAGLYLVACIGSTVAFNVPLNDRLDAVAGDSDEGRALWARYLVTWTRWNHVRTVATLLSTVLLALAAVALGRAAV